MDQETVVMAWAEQEAAAHRLVWAQRALLLSRWAEATCGSHYSAARLEGRALEHSLAGDG